ncbi:hypothetical protein GJAV_G00187350 [Gymnothorax javanicus]|nr:hypothetical protein GJAV_G00187350 [Gymnothorax javanicus]
MKTALCLALLALTVSLHCNAVQVKEREFTFSLESVRQLKDLMESDLAGKESPRVAKTSTAIVCNDPGLPADFRSLCQSKGAGLSLARLAYIGNHYDECEICMFAACTGC